MKICRKGQKTQKKCVNQSNQVKSGNSYSFVFKSQNFAKVVENFAQTCVCVSAAFRNSANILIKQHTCLEHISLSTVFFLLLLPLSLLLLLHPACCTYIFSLYIYLQDFIHISLLLFILLLLSLTLFLFLQTV